MSKRIYSFANYSWYAAGIGFMLVAPLAVTIVLNRAGSPEEVGLYSLAYAVTAPMQAFLGMHARTFIAMDRLYGYRPADVAAQRLHMMIGLFLGAGIVVAARGFAEQEVAVLAALCLVRTAEGLAEITAGVMQREHRPDLIAVAYGVRAVVAIGIFASLYGAGFGLPISLAGMATASLIAFALLDRRLLNGIDASLPWSGVVESVRSPRPFRLFRHLLPAALLILLSVVETNTPRYVVESATGLINLGIYTSLTFVLYAATNLIVPIYQMTIAPLGQWAARTGSVAARHATRIVIVNVLIAAAAGVALVVAVRLCGTELAVWGLGPHYAGQGALLIALGVSAAVGMLRSCFGFVLTGLDAIRTLSMMSVGNMALFGMLVFAGAGGEGVVGIAWDWAMASGTIVAVESLIAAWRLLQLWRGNPLIVATQEA
jgi:O-antigen/teichoic acid export membrane protein